MFFASNDSGYHQLISHWQVSAVPNTEQQSPPLSCALQMLTHLIPVMLHIVPQRAEQCQGQLTERG